MFIDIAKLNLILNGVMYYMLITATDLIKAGQFFKLNTSFKLARVIPSPL